MSWAVLCSLVAVGAFGGLQWRSSEQQQRLTAFRAEAVGVGSTVSSALLRMNDLTVAASSAIQASPGMTNAQFQRWTTAMHPSARYPGNLGVGYVVPVTNAGLQAHAQLMKADPSPALLPVTGAFTPLPPTSGTQHCFIRLVAVPEGTPAMFPANFDICAVTDVFAISRDTGQFTVMDMSSLGGPGILALATPLYRGAVTPTSQAERRRLHTGWVTALVDPNLLLKDTLAKHPHLGVTLKRQDMTAAQVAGTLSGLTQAMTASAESTAAMAAALTSDGTPLGTAGVAKAAHMMSMHFTLVADGIWSIDVHGSSTAAGWSADQQGAAVFGGSAFAGLLLFLLLQVLARSRGRALQLVDERTDELRFQALHDGLTGLANRVLIMDRADQLLANNRRDNGPVAAMFIDLDGFKGVNDSFGHPSGDQLLVTVAERLQRALREGDTVGRLGGDEFVVLTHGTQAAIHAVAGRILEVLREPFTLDTFDGVALISVTASVGVAMGLRDHAQDLLRDADIALYAAKAKGKNCYVIFQPEMHVAVTDRVAMEMDLRSALSGAEFHLAYQPTVELETGAVTGVEALLRWQHPTRGLVPPLEFIPIVEQSGLMIELGCWVLQEACTQGAAWHALGYQVDMSVNVSSRQLDSPTFVDDVRAALTRSGMSAARLVLEITESTLMRDPDGSAERLTELKALGIRVAIDDFGTGYSSLAYLQKFPVDMLKIDRTFIAALSDNEKSAGLVDTLVQLGKTLGLGTVAEGIEDDAQLAYVRAQGCESGQGYKFARPMGPDAVELFFKGVRVDLVVPAPRAVGVVDVV
jgi:diguanylate cyclase (GGDEF)-like protein